jgi:hypothetical protein
MRQDALARNLTVLNKFIHILPARLLPTKKAGAIK